MIKNRHYFVYGNTAQGFVSKLSSNLQGIGLLYIVRGRPGTGKALVMPYLAGICEKSGLPAEFLHCPTEPETCDVIVLPELKLAVADATDLHDTGEIPKVQSVRYIDTDSVFDRDPLSDAVLQEIMETIVAGHQNAFRHFQDALAVHDEWEKIYISNMDFRKADLLTSYAAELLLGGRRTNRLPVSKERFFGASTPAGAMDYIESLTAGISKRYLLKGRPGTGKSTLLKKLAASSAERGLDTEVYSCAFDSKSLDMIIWPELDKCLFDSTAPHLYEPSRPDDEVIDMYKECVKPGTDETYESELEDIAARYRDAVSLGTACLAEAKSALDGLMKLYEDASDNEKIREACGDFTQLLHR